MLQFNAVLKNICFSRPGKFCVGQFDGWSCFLDTPINTIAKASCPPLFEFDTSRKSKAHDTK
jgi:hypothetical protein